MAVLAGFCMFSSTANAASDSTYTKLDLDQDCEFYSSHEQGGSAECTGYNEFPVFFAEGDLRQMVRFGHVARETQQWESFAQFNRINDTIEWRLEGGEPYATILRWFIEGADPETGEVTNASTGQVLVISTVGTSANPVSCIAGYVDARANKDANVLARQVAGTNARDFECGIDLPDFHGKRGPWSGDPSILAN